MKSFIKSPELNQSTTPTLASSNSSELIGANKRSCSSRGNVRTKMQTRSRVINKLALVLLSIVVLELVLIGDQVQPVKAIKKKILLKKLKKLLPLLALMKPKKKIILLPIPLPMFNKEKSPPYYPGPRPRPHTRPISDGSAPMSFMMVGDGPVVGVPMDGSHPPPSFSMLPMTMSGTTNSMDPFIMELVGDGANSVVRQPSPKPVQPIAANASDTQPVSTMVMPSMTMTIQSEPGGSAIELSTNLNPVAANASTSGMSGSLLQRPHSGIKWQPQQLQQQQQQQHQVQLQQYNDHFDEPSEPAGGEQYYSSPWMAKPMPLASPAKLIRNERFRARPQNVQKQQPQQLQLSPQINHQTVSTTAPQPPFSGRQVQQPTQQQHHQLQHQIMPTVVIKNHWRPHAQPPTSSPAIQLQQQLQPQEQPQQQHGLEYEEFIPIGPPQMMHVYQTPNGQLHMSPPPPPPPQPPSPAPSQRPQREAQGGPSEYEEVVAGRATGAADLNSEVQTLGNGNELPINVLHDSRASGQSEGQPSPQLQQTPPSPFQRQPAALLPVQSGRLASPAIKGKQQQQQQQQSKRKSVVAGGY